MRGRYIHAERTIEAQSLKPVKKELLDHDKLYHNAFYVSLKLMAFTQHPRPASQKSGTLPDLVINPPNLKFWGFAPHRNFDFMGLLQLDHAPSKAGCSFPPIATAKTLSFGLTSKRLKFHWLAKVARHLDQLSAIKDETFFCVIEELKQEFRDFLFFRFLFAHL